MKKILLMLLSLALVFSAVGCDNGEEPAGGTDSKVTGSIVYFFGEEDSAIKTFNSENTQPKQIELSRGVTYTIGLRPSFKGSKSAFYQGDCASFSFGDGCCDIAYIGDVDNKPTYTLVVKSSSNFDLTVKVNSYIQTVKIIAV